MRIVNVIIFSLLFGSYVYATNDTIQTTFARQYAYAINLLDGINIEMDYNKARRILSYLSSQNYAPAMRTWGTIYNNGLGVAPDKEKAFKAYYKASKLGDAKSMTNLGLMYLNGDYVKVDYEKAMYWFKNGLSAGDKQNNYNIGYLYYKGYGVEQSYSKALQYFTEGSKIENEGICKYMIGICYLKGYGVEINEDIGKSWIEKAADDGYERAIDYILHYQSIYRKDSVNSKGLNMPTYTPNRMPSQTNQLYMSNFSGDWEGKLYTLDWSKQLVESEQALTLSIVQDVDCLDGLWTIDGTEIPFSAKLNNSRWEITAPLFRKEKGGNLLMRYCNLTYIRDSENEIIEGDIQIERVKTKEPTMPNYFRLTRKNIPINSYYLPNQHSALRLYPNPIIGNNFTISIFVPQKQNILLKIYDINGCSIFTQESILEEGENYLNLSPKLASGVYILFVNGETLHNILKFVKK